MIIKLIVKPAKSRMNKDLSFNADKLYRYANRPVSRALVGSDTRYIKDPKRDNPPTSKKHENNNRN